MRDPATHAELDRLPAVARESACEAAHRHTDFEPSGWTAIRLTGNASDRGVDPDGNGLFEELRVELEVELAKADVYEWQATLQDARGTSIDWDRRTATLEAGRATITFAFDGRKIRHNGVDGPYLVKSMGMFGITGPSVVIPSAARTRAYSSSSFEQ